MPASESNWSPNSLVGAGEPGDAPVQHVEDHREPDERRRHCCNWSRIVGELDAAVATEHVGHREEAGQDVDAAANASPPTPPCVRSPRSSASSPTANRARTVSAARTRSRPAPTMHASRGTKNTSIREPNFIRPNRSPARTSEPATARRGRAWQRMPTIYPGSGPCANPAE